MIPDNLPPGCTDKDIEDNANGSQYCDYCGHKEFNGECSFCQAQEDKADAQREDDLG